jgi:mannose-6-phosphate isomerase-like protein (cupin superfamily)
MTTSTGDAASLIAIGKRLPAWQASEPLRVNGAPVRIMKFEGHHPMLHQHDVDECYVVLEGELLVELEDRPAQRLVRGDAYVVRAGTAHRPFGIPTAIVLLLG